MEPRAGNPVRLPKVPLLLCNCNSQVAPFTIDSGPPGLWNQTSKFSLILLRTSAGDFAAVQPGHDYRLVKAVTVVGHPDRG
jgi:hypothetical protein